MPQTPNSAFSTAGRLWWSSWELSACDGRTASPKRNDLLPYVLLICRSILPVGQHQTGDWTVQIYSSKSFPLCLKVAQFQHFWQWLCCLAMYISMCGALVETAINVMLCLVKLWKQWEKYFAAHFCPREPKKRKKKSLKKRRKVEY